MQIGNALLQMLVATFEADDPLIDSQQIRAQLFQGPFDGGHATFEGGNSLLERHDLRGQRSDLVIDTIEPFIDRVEVPKVIVELLMDGRQPDIETFIDDPLDVGHDQLSMEPYKIAPGDRSFIHDTIVPRTFTNAEDFYRAWMHT